MAGGGASHPAQRDMTQYDQSDIEAALRGVGLSGGDTVYVISALWRFRGLAGSKATDDQSPVFYRSLRRVIGDNGTVVVPTTTHNLCNTDVAFDLASTPSHE